MKRQVKGFSLVELMVTVAIVGVIAATAFTLTATPTGACGSGCPTITLDQTGNQTVTGP
ncbi:MAG: prepilin-type N-terminal cleavage/methylation domain-containing protein [Gammaproteobacteria bacterium]|nr:prepilin-type N-terminal cleavage/methylation domain-containing protein [Gammaproteobacteria bacterium]MBT4494554.1 prepilin-type N-terminal cleavage/methylation domain-containing protein [Gammaproteobacteria bacterium]